jgi:parvulin-like peptidyl-prolyl isomerase
VSFAQVSAWAKPLLGNPRARPFAVRARTVALIMAVVAVPRVGHPEEDHVAARVNGTAITMTQLDRAVEDRVPRITGHGGISEARRGALRVGLLEEMIDEELMVQEAKRQRVTVSPAAVNDEVAKIRKRFADDAQYLHALARSGRSESDVRRGVERFLLVKTITDKEVAAKVAVDEASMRAYYDADPSRFILPEQVRYRQILIAVDPAGSPAAWDAAKRRAAQAAAQARAGTPFSELAAAHSDDQTTRASGGDMGWVHRGRLEHDQEEAIFALPAGGVSDPVRTLYGIAVYQVEEKRAPRALAWEDVNKSRLADELRQAETSRLRAAWLADLKRRATVEILATPHP